MPEISALRETLRTAGLNAALAQLNLRVPHRFTAVYQLNGDVMRNVAIFDKQGEVVPDSLLSVPFTSSFCQFVLRDGFFKLEGDADERLDGHPYKGVVESYVGVPVARDDRTLVGTLCHFDFPALPVADGEFEFMQEAARELPAFVAPFGTLSGSGAASVLPHLHSQIKIGKGS